MRRLGIQLSANIALDIGLPVYGTVRIPLTSTWKSFIPATTIQDVLLLEGIVGWTVIWYLAVLQDDGESVKLRVAFEVSVGRFKACGETDDSPTEDIAATGATSSGQESS